MIQVMCECGSAFQAPDHFAGRTVRCPNCNGPLTITEPLEPDLLSDPLQTGGGYQPAYNYGQSPYAQRSQGDISATGMVALIGGGVLILLIMGVGLYLVTSKREPIKPGPVADEQLLKTEPEEKKKKKQGRVRRSPFEEIWERHESNRGSYKAIFPGKAYAQSTGFSYKDLVLFNGQTWEIEYTMFPSLNGGTPKENLDRLYKETVADMQEAGIEINTDRTLKVAGQPAYQFSYVMEPEEGRKKDLLEDDDGRREYHYRIFIIGRTSFYMRWEGHPSKASYRKINRFFDSFEYVK